MALGLSAFPGAIVGGYGPKAEQPGLDSAL